MILKSKFSVSNLRAQPFAPQLFLCYFKWMKSDSVFKALYLWITIWSAVYRLLSDQMHYGHYVQLSGSLIRSLKKGKPILDYYKSRHIEDTRPRYASFPPQDKSHKQSRFRTCNFSASQLIISKNCMHTQGIY